MLSVSGWIGIVSAKKIGMKTGTDSVLTAKEVFRLVESDLEEVELRLTSEAQSSLSLVNDINRYLHDSGGKRLRPAVLLLTSKLCGLKGDPVIVLSSVVELIHVATLVHDDIIDNSQVRRGQPSVNTKWGSEITVLMGDWLYMTAFQVALQQRDFRILDVLISITRQMVEGELLQLEYNGRLDITEEEQLEICLRKTACLFSGCGRMSGILARLEPEKEEQLSLYGRSLGMAFQLADDLLDYTGQATVLGKPVLKDLEEGKVTLPIIFLMQQAKSSERDFVRGVVESQDFSKQNKREILRLIKAYDTVAKVRDAAEKYAREAQECLADFPDSIYRDALLSIPELVISRRK